MIDAKDIETYIDKTKYLVKYKENIDSIMKHINLKTFSISSGYMDFYQKQYTSQIMQDEPNYNFSLFKDIDDILIKSKLSDSMAYILRYSNILCHTEKCDIGIVEEIKKFDEFLREQAKPILNIK